MLETSVSVGGMSPSFLNSDQNLSNDFHSTFQGMDGTSLGNALGQLTLSNGDSLAAGMELLSPFVQNLSPLEQVNFEKSLGDVLALDCGGVFPYGGEPMQSKVYAIPPGFRATNMDPTHRLVLNSNGVLVNNPNYQKAIDGSKIDYVKVAADLIVIGTAAVGIPLTGLSGSALVLGSAAQTVSEVRSKTK